MKTIANHIEKSQLVKNIVKSELNKMLPVFLLQNNRTGNTLLTSQPYFFGGEIEKQSIGIICGNEDGMGDDTYSMPIDTINDISELIGVEA